MKTPNIGQIITTPQTRDAIHFAVAPVKAGETLRPGQDVGLRGEPNDKKAFAKQNDVILIGIVDPFLKRPVMHGQTFWLFLYPETITSLRHDWTHHAFD